ncbi:AAA family ATPase [Vibrio mimicus]|uniref:Type II secretion protein n=1 Tax=Vibrio mimicus TaxID=674 RepID=A0A2J9UWV5_VIBMI|nr:type II/IV secretion system ATPase TadZ/CpaE [Vibrio mimicus]ERM56124.1 type II/IV secretion system ATPase TadZ/CpaE [Vibrio mimicus CAIM 1883]ERM56253.1 type II/IV secretion system ATPase TadZ/CpaE [Vibrio mimicus CAIM 1882]AMG04768.1 type II secretion protein [Vibrio mimicus]EMB50714.1 type II/IV secretion system ATPase TadZ/CpaE [Vibrio mimicus CAIM 602]MBY7674579.1 type II secretion protein [Vibrio mimicus]
MGEAVKLSRNNEDSYIRLKTSLHIWVLYSSERFQLHMGTQLKLCKNLSFDLISLSNVNVSGLTHLTPPDLIFVETGPNWAQKVLALQEYEAPSDDFEASLIVFGDEDDNGALKIALRLGAADFVSDKAMMNDFFHLLKNVSEEKLASRELGELHLFINTKGGCGASTLALNTALEIAASHPEKVLLLDLDIPFGVISEYLSITPQYSLTDVIEHAKDLDHDSLSAMVTKMDNGLHVLGFFHENTTEDFDKAREIGRLLPILREIYPYVVIDLSRGVDRIFSAVVAPATKVFLVAQQNLAAIKNTSRILRLLTLEYGVAKEQIELIINRYEKRASINIKDIEKTIAGISVFMIPNDYRVAIESANLGRPIVMYKKNTAITRSIVDFSHHIALPEAEKKTWFKKLFS